MPGRASVLCFNTALVLSVLVFGPAVGHGATLYVDGQISASCTTYAVTSRSCSGGSARAYRAVAGAAAAAVAGDTVYVRAGTYSGQLAPARSGTATLPITFAAYTGERPTLSGTPNPALWLIQRSYIVVDGLTVSNVGGWGRLENATHNTIRNCTFTGATILGSAGGLKLVRSTYNKVLDNTFNNGNDNITIQESDRNVIQGNTISTGRHSLLSLRCGNYNVVRGNTFSNPSQKNLEIYDCEGTSDAPIKLNATKRNLVDNNVIANTHASSVSHDYNGIQFGGQQGIVRRNVFRDDLGGGINFQYYFDESLYNNRNRVYHNTFYNNRCYGIVGNTGDSSRYYDNRARNNILYKNTSCSGAATQTSITNASRVILSDNAVLTTSPGFVDEAARDLRLAPGSPMIDAAAFLATTTVAGSGTQMTVANASYFFDGYGIPGELGDEIQLQGQTTVARVLAVDLAANRLTLDRSLSWAAGTGVALRYDGAKPDMGAYESTGGGTTPAQLAVAKAGTGSGTVTSSPAGISCGTDCSEAYDSSSETSSATTPPPGDFDGDGKPDLLWHNQRTGQLKTWLLDRGSMKADPDITPDGLADTSWQVRGLADFNGDGHSDILWQHLQTGELRVWLMNQTSLVDDVELTTRRLGFGWQIGGVADFNGDGKADILWHDQRRGTLYVWLMDATTAVAGAYITAEGNPDTSWQINGLADFNGDGEADILWRHKRTGDLHVWFMKGTKAIGASSLLPARAADPQWQIARVADLDEDGQTDILWHNRLTGDLLVWYMNGIRMTSRAPLDPRQAPDTDWTVVSGAAGASVPGVTNKSAVEP